MTDKAKKRILIPNQEKTKMMGGFRVNISTAEAIEALAKDNNLPISTVISSILEQVILDIEIDFI